MEKMNRKTAINERDEPTSLKFVKRSLRILRDDALMSEKRSLVSMGYKLFKVRVELHACT